MKSKIYSSIFVILFLGLFVQNNIYAQFNSCDDTCRFNPKPSYSFPLDCCPNCIVTVDYATSDCNGFCSLKINSFSLNGIGCPQITANDLVNVVAKQILLNWQILTDCSYESGDTLKVMNVYNAVCMKWVGTLGTHEPTNAQLVPCESQGCCLSRYIAVRQIDGTWKVTLLWKQVNGICNDSSPDCFIICE
jgi:hypothetical protein